MDTNNKDFPQTELQENIRSFWSVRGHSEVRAILGNLSITFHRPNPKYVGMGIEYQYLEQFWKEAQRELMTEVIREFKSNGDNMVCTKTRDYLFKKIEEFDIKED